MSEPSEEEAKDPMHIVHPALGVAEVVAHMATKALPKALGPAGMALGMAEAAAESDSPQDFICGMEESIPLLGVVPMLTGCRFPAPSDVTPEERMIQQCFDPETSQIATPEEAEQMAMEAEEQRAQECVQR